MQKKWDCSDTPTYFADVQTIEESSKQPSFLHLGHHGCVACCALLWPFRFFSPLNWLATPTPLWGPWLLVGQGGAVVGSGGSRPTGPTSPRPTSTHLGLSRRAGETRANLELLLTISARAPHALRLTNSPALQTRRGGS